MRLAIFVVLSAFLCRVTIWPPFPRSCERELRSSSLATDHLSAARLLFQFWPEFAATSAEPVSVGSRSRRIGALALPCHHRLCWRVYKLCISIVRPMRRRVRCDRFRHVPRFASVLPSPAHLAWHLRRDAGPRCLPPASGPSPHLLRAPVGDRSTSGDEGGSPDPLPAARHSAGTSLHWSEGHDGSASSPPLQHTDALRRAPARDGVGSGDVP